MSITGLYYDGQTAESHSIEISLDSLGMLHASPALFEPIALEEVTLSSRIGNIARTLTLPSGAMVETNDHAVLDEWLVQNQITSGRTHKLESSFKYVIVAVVFMVGFVGWTAIYGIPMFSKVAAYALPEEVNNYIGQGTMESLDERFFTESDLDLARQQSLTKRFEQLLPVSNNEDAVQYQLLFRKSPVIGANAFALPNGTVVVTDELVALAEHDDEIFSVLLHEIGHVEHRHSLRQVISHSGLAVMTVLITGDVNSAGGLILALPNLLVSSSYSRDLEWEADGYALERMQDLGMPPSRFADFMEKLEHSVPKHKDSDEDPESIVLNDELADKDSQVDKPKLECAPKEEADEGIIDLGWFDYIASHPPSAERIARFREAETLR